MHRSIPLAVAMLALGLSACGILTAPVSVPAAVAENAFFNLKGPVVDQDGKPVDGVIMQGHNIHHFWTPIKGSTDVVDDLTRRVDGRYDFDYRGSSVDLTFTKDGYHPARVRMYANQEREVHVNRGTWDIPEEFPVVLLSMRPADVNLVQFDRSISYADYPIADCIPIPNVATGGRSGDTIYSGKDAEDPTVFPPGTVYLTLDKQAPPAINTKGDIDPADLDIPHHVTLRLPGNQSGFIRIAPRPGYDPIAASDVAPESGYLHELRIDRVRLKAMRRAPLERFAEAHEYFFFRAGDYYGKGDFTWSSPGGKPAFRFSLYIQPEAGNRVLRNHGLAR